MHGLASLTQGMRSELQYLALSEVLKAGLRDRCHPTGSTMGPGTN